MDADLRELYQEVIVDHSRRPRNFGSLGECTHSVEGVNPLCGDEVTIYVNVDDGRVREVSFEGQGCAISTASASVMTEIVKGMSVAEARAVFDRFHGLVTGESGPEAGDIGKLAVFAGISQFPSRVKCAILCWHTFRAALDGSEEQVTTE